MTLEYFKKAVLAIEPEGFAEADELALKWLEDAISDNAKSGGLLLDYIRKELLP